MATRARTKELAKKLVKATARALALALAGAASTGCSTYYEARFDPSPLEMRVEDPQAPGVLARGLASVRGVRRPSDGQPAQFDVLLRVENIGPQPFSLDLESFELVTADLATAGPGRVGSSRVEPGRAESGRVESGRDDAGRTDSGATNTEPPNEVLAAGDVRQLEIAFPLPAGRSYGDLDLSGLSLRWALRSNGQRVVASGSFRRRVYSSAPYYYGSVFWIGPGYWRTHSRVGAFCAY
jgi:hypothetical protein